LKVEVVRVLQMGVRDKRYSADEGIERVQAFRGLPITYVANDLLLEGAFRLASRFQMALYDALYVALADAVDAPFLTADRRLFNLSRQRGIARVSWFEDFSVPSMAE
jgi:predicted nucleic acid-binding protein